MIRIFISSVQKELAAERAAVRDYVRGSRLLRKFFDVFLFEEVPAADVRADALYLDEVGACDLYLGIFGLQYGYAEAGDESPTHKEFSEAGRLGKYRLVFVKGADDELREPGMLKLIREAGDELIRRRFTANSELISAVDDALVKYLEDRGFIQNVPFDGAPCSGATLDDLDAKQIEKFGRRAQKDRMLPKDAEEILTHLNLLNDGVPSHAAVLLFGSDPQRFLVSSVVKCAHFHTPEVVKPIPSAQVYGGTVFDMIEQAVDFVMSKIDRRVGTRKDGATAPVEYEIPREVVAEAIVNAVAHRDYASHGSVQVMLFPDRLEIANPGSLPGNLTLEDLRGPHISVPTNPRLADPLSRTEYVERLGTGTRDMIRRCSEVGLREPEFAITDGFVVRIFRKSGQVANPNGQVGGQVAGQVDVWVLEVLRACVQEPLKSKEIQLIAGIKHRESFQRNYLDKLLDEGWVERTIPDKPTSRLQKYQLTAKGMELLKVKEEDS